MTNIVAVKKDQHKNLKVSSKRDLTQFAGQHIAPVNVREFGQASTSYPIVLIHDEQSKQYRSIAMLGLETGENLYLDDSKWQAIYVPQAFSNIPFSLGLDPDKEQTLTSCIDLDSPFVGEDKDVALFDENGEETEFYKSMHDQLGRLYESEVATQNFVKMLEENDLLQELELKIDFTDGQNKRLVGLFGINDKKLTELADDKVLEMHKSGAFMAIYAMLSSAGQINRLAQLRNTSNNPQKVVNVQFALKQEEEK